MLITAHHAIVQNHQATAAFEEFFQIGSLRPRNLHPVRRVDNHHVGFLKLLRLGEIEIASDFQSALAEQCRPLLEKAGMIVLVWSVSFDTTTDEDAQRFSRSRRKRRHQERSNDQ